MASAPWNPAAPPVDGLFQYMADAATFSDCRTGRRYPVATERDYASLERAYTSAGSRSGLPMSVTVIGHVERRARVDAPGDEEAMVIDDVVAVRAGSSACQAPAAVAAAATTRVPNLPAPAALVTNRWQLVELDNRRVAPPAKREPGMILEVNEDDVNIFGAYVGCNEIRGRWKSTGAPKLSFNLASPREMTCGSETDALETALVNALWATKRYEIVGDDLVLYDDKGVRARFHASVGGSARSP